MDNKRALVCCKILKEFFDKEPQDLAVVAFPNIITYGTDEWLTYIFYSCLLDYGMRSKIYHQNLIDTYNSHPKIFNPRNVADNIDTTDLRDIIRNNIHPRYPNIAVKKWISLSQKLAKYNLLKTIKDFKSFSELSAFVKNINEYGQKTGGLLLRLIVDSGICTFKNELEFIPLDRHDIEISFLNGITDSKKLSNAEIRELSDTWILNAKLSGINPFDIDKYLWEIGNRFCNKKDCPNCPLKDTCQTLIKKGE